MALYNPEQYIGQVVGTTIAVEKIMDSLLAQHFCADPQRIEEFSNMILFHERITFEFKKEILITIIKTHYKWLPNKYSLLLKYFGEIPEHRNRFAHLETVGYRDSKEIDFINENNIPVWNGLYPEKRIDMSNPYHIIFRRYKNGQPRYVGYEMGDISQMQKNVMYVVDAFRDLFISIRDADLPPEQINL